MTFKWFNLSAIPVKYLVHKINRWTASLLNCGTIFFMNRFKNRFFDVDKVLLIVDNTHGHPSVDNF